MFIIQYTNDTHTSFPPPTSSTLPIRTCYSGTVLTLRLRMPISDDLSPRNFITKISKYEKVVNIPNSMTVLHDLLPVAVDMAKCGIAGVFNFVNPGVIRCVLVRAVRDVTSFIMLAPLPI